jgi:hypothetical protein
VGPARERIEERAHLLVEEGVVGDVVLPLLELGGVGEPSVDQQVRDLEEGARTGEVLDAVAAVEQDAAGAIDVRDGRTGRCRVPESGVVGDVVGRRAQLEDVDPRLSDGGLVDVELDGVGSEVERRFRRGAVFRAAASARDGPILAGGGAGAVCGTFPAVRSAP